MRYWSPLPPLPPGFAGVILGDGSRFCLGGGSLTGADAVEDLTVDSKAGTARLVVEIVLEGCPAGIPDPFMLHLDLTWTSTGIISRSHSTTHSSSSNTSTKTITHSSTVAGDPLPGGLDVVDDLEFRMMSFNTSRTVFTSH